MGGAAAAAIAATVGVAAPANASAAQITTIVSWVGGDTWLDVDYPGQGVVMEGWPVKSVTDYWTAYSGDRIGADPITGDADFITCTVMINGRVVAFDSAYAGDGTDANCVTYLR